MSVKVGEPNPAAGPELADLAAALHRFVGSLERDPHDVDDIVQETLARVLPARDRLDPLAVTGYAFTVARNLVHDLHRGEARRRRLLPRLVEESPPEQPEAVVVELEERRALRIAIGRLPAEQRALMLAHDLHGEPLTEIAEGESPQALAARLARARARARVDYVLALRGVSLPTARCRPVLQSLSAGDRRRQAALRSGRHLVACATCAALAPVLLRRDRALAGLLPWFSATAALSWLASTLRRRPVQLGVTTTGVATGALVVAATWPWSAAPAAPPADLVVSSHALLPLRDRLGSYEGQDARGRAVPVLAVPADEGFWVGHGDRRVWVQLRGQGESPVEVHTGDRVSFTGRVVAHGSGFADREGVTAREGAAELTRQRYHLSVDRSELSTS